MDGQPAQLAVADLLNNGTSSVAVAEQKGLEIFEPNQFGVLTPLEQISTPSGTVPSCVAIGTDTDNSHYIAWGTDAPGGTGTLEVTHILPDGAVDTNYSYSFGYPDTATGVVFGDFSGNGLLAFAWTNPDRETVFVQGGSRIPMEPSASLK